jgi:hypothetical protein
MSITLEDSFYEDIPDEVLNDPSWEPKLLPDLEDPFDTNYTWNDIVEDNEYE